MQTFDSLNIMLWQQIIGSIPDEMGVALERTAFSPNIKERRDHSCAIFLADGRLLAQAAHIPVHLGAMPLMMEMLLPIVKWRDGDMWLCNDPHFGGTHLPDFTLVAPIFAAKKLIGFVANRAHHADIGGMSPGSLPLSTEIYQEGLLIPPVKLIHRNRMNEDILAIVCANSRTQEERRGDIFAQVSANQLGRDLFVKLFNNWEDELWQSHCEQIFNFSRFAMENELRNCQQGTFHYEDFLDDDGQGNFDIPIRVSITISHGKMTCDFTGTSAELQGSLNCTEAVTRSACYYVARCLLDANIPANAGLMECMQVIAPDGSALNASHHKAISAGNTETSQRIVDVLMGALSQAIPGRIPAGSQGTMNNLLIGGWDSERQRSFSYYETICGGAGANSHDSGPSAIQVHMTNTLNTPIEILESHFPLRVRKISIRRGSGGKGIHAGGDGVIREIELTGKSVVTVISERRLRAPRGVNGGESGMLGVNSIRNPEGPNEIVESKFTKSLPAGSVITLETPGGGGWGKNPF